MPIHVAITRKVIPGCERAFEESLRGFFQESLEHREILGVHLLSPPPGTNSREYGILRTFASDREKDEFYRSELFERWQKQEANMIKVRRSNDRGPHSGADYRSLLGRKTDIKTAARDRRNLWQRRVIIWKD